MSRIEKLLKAIINNTTYDEPRLSRIEEIFYSILNSLPYNANAQSRIEALLLALKESGLYDERTLSRIEEILKCKLDGRTYTGWIGSRVEMLLNEWELSEIIEATFTSFPIIIKANGEPLIDYLISGNMSQSGTPTQETPIQPQGTGEMSAQLIPYPFYSSDGEYAGVQFTTDNGRIIANGTLTSGLLYYLWRPANFQAGTYTMSVKGKHSGATIYFRDTTHNVSVAPISSAQEGDRSVTFTVTEEIRAMVYINAGSGTLDFDCTIMLNAGEEALPFEPTNGYKIPISSASTTTNVYLGEVESTRQIVKYEFTGQEEWARPSSNIFRVGISGYLRQNDYTPICSHYKGQSAVSATSELDDYSCAFLVSGSGNNYFYIRDLNYDAYTDFKTYLAQQYANGTPVTVWYVLATETTGIVNEPLRKIGDYADTVSMEQAGVEIPTLNKPNNTVIDVETTLKPSKMYVKYNGEGKRVYITADGKLYITSNNEIYILKR